MMKHLGTRTLIAVAICLISISGAFAQNYKIRQSVSMNGQKSDSTTYVRGSRKRTEGGGPFGGDVATVEQCDMKRNLTISDKKRMYAVAPFDTGEDAAEAPKSSAGKVKNAPVTRGGTVTITTNTTDTGERKQMFGMNARHVKSSTSMASSPDACNPANTKIETDGWYIDLPEFSCPMTVREQMPQMPVAPGGCRDKFAFHASGGGKLGFPLTETRSISMGDAGMAFTQSTDTLEFSKATLDAALFDIPQGYTLTENSSDLYGRPDFSAMSRAGRSNNDDDTPSRPTQAGAKRPGVKRIGVIAPSNQSSENVSGGSLQRFLVERLSNGNVEAVAVGSESEARSAGCDYLLTSDISKLKQSTAGKIGGIFGKVAGAPTSGSYDAQVDFKLTSLSGGSTILTNKATAKTETDATRAAEGVLSQEAGMVTSAVR